jgi:hypothetical protein
MKLKKYIDQVVKDSPATFMFQVAIKIMELEALSNYFELMYGVELDINVKPIKRPEGRFYGKSLIDELPTLKKGE